MNRFSVSLAAFAAIAVSAGAQVPAPAPTPPVVSPPIDTTYVDYRESWITLPLGLGFRIPSYNRVDGAVVPWGPEISLADDRIRIDPTIAYRSHIGKIDPFVLLRAHTNQPLGLALELAGGRGTFTNDAWIRSDIVNSLAALFVGSDSRNYFRSDRFWGFVSKEIGFTHGTLTPAVGARFERDWSTGVPFRHTNAPWSMFGKTDTLKMRRTNPSIDEGRINSALGRLVGEYEREGVKGSFEGLVEHSFRVPDRPGLDASDSESQFTQVTLHGVLGFPTFRTQRFDFRGHTVLSGGGVPRQRFAYLGGAGTLATVDLLALGGDVLYFAEGTYSVPLERIILPIVGSPILSLRYAAGSAGQDDLPDLIQNIGFGLGVKMIKVEYHIDPNYKKTSFTHKTAFAVSLDLAL